MTLYKNQEETFKEFTFRLIEKAKDENHKKISIESLYRHSYGSFLKRELGSKCANIYIEAPFEIRANREFERLRKVNIKNNQLDLEQIIYRVKEKDEFKIKHGADKCKMIADYIIDNDGNMDYENFLLEINTIVSKVK